MDRNLTYVVKTPQELGLDYLSHEPMQLAASDNALIDAIHRAKEEVSVLPEDIPLRFPLGTNHPIYIGQLPDEGTFKAQSTCDAVGFIDSSGTEQSFTSSVLSTMFTTEARNGGNIEMTSEVQHILVADASDRLSQEMRIPAINLIARCKPDNQIFVVEKANANAVCRDAVNATLNKTIKEFADNANRYPVLW